MEVNANPGTEVQKQMGKEKPIVLDALEIALLIASSRIWLPSCQMNKTNACLALLLIDDNWHSDL